MQAKRQNIQLELALGAVLTGEARSAAAEGTEVGVARAASEPPAIGQGPSMEMVIEPGNMKKALARVRRNKGAPGIDGMRVEDLGAHLQGHWPEIRSLLLSGTYTPQAVRQVEIPKASGGVRALGVPTVVDRFIQQAVMQVLQREWDPGFSDSSYGFRPGRSAHQAVKRAQDHIRAGFGIVVDLDLEKFFDQVCHDVVMGLVAKRVSDRRLLRVIRGFLSAGARGRSGESASRRDAAGRPAVAVVVEPDAGRCGQGVGESRPSLRALRRRLQHLRAVEAGGRAGDGKRDRLPCPASETEGEHGQERGGSSVEAQLSGLQLHGWWAGQAAPCAAGAGTVQVAGSEVDARHEARQSPSSCFGVVALPRWMAGLLRVLRDRLGVAQPRPVDKASASCRRLASMEAWSQALCGAASPGRWQGLGGQDRW